jgi:hypothetical protein
MPGLDNAIAILEADMPKTERLATDQLRAAGYGDLTPSAIQAIAEICGRHPSLRITGRLVVDAEADPVVEKAIRAIRSKSKALAASSGASNIDYLSAAVDLRVSPELLELIVEEIPGMIEQDGWFWMRRPIRRDKIAKVVRKVLSIHQPQTIRSLREAVRRRLALHGIEPIPPTHILSSLLRDDPSFRVEDDQVWSTSALDMAEELGELELAMIRILIESDGSILTSYDLGLNMHSVSVYTSYSPVLERVAPGLWTARGQPLDPVMLELARKRLDQPAAPKVRDGGWTASGNPWFTFELNKSNFAGPVATVDPSIRAVVRSKNLPAYTSGGVDAGNIGFSDNGATAWGFIKAIGVLGAEPDDILRVDIDLIHKSAIVSLETDED